MATLQFGQARVGVLAVGKYLIVFVASLDLAALLTAVGDKQFALTDSSDVQTVVLKLRSEAQICGVQDFLSDVLLPRVRGKVQHWRVQLSDKVGYLVIFARQNCIYSFTVTTKNPDTLTKIFDFCVDIDAIVFDLNKKLANYLFFNCGKKKKKRYSFGY